MVSLVGSVGLITVKVSDSIAYNVFFLSISGDHFKIHYVLIPNWPTDHHTDLLSCSVVAKNHAIVITKTSLYKF